MSQMCAAYKPAVMNSWKESIPLPQYKHRQELNSFSVWLVADSSSVYFYKPIKNAM